MLAMLSTIYASTLVQAWVTPEHGLLQANRVFTDLMWRCLLGTCMPPSHVFYLVNAAYAIGLCTSYAAHIPENIVVLGGSDGIGLMTTCTHTVSSDNILKGLGMLRSISKLEVARKFSEGVLQQMTDFLDAVKFGDLIIFCICCIGGRGGHVCDRSH